MKKPTVFSWTVTVLRPGKGASLTAEPIAADKLQASHRAAVMLGLNWKNNARYMHISGPNKTRAGRVREWNQTYPQWSTEERTSKDGKEKHHSGRM